MSTRPAAQGQGTGRWDSRQPSEQRFTVKSFNAVTSLACWESQWPEKGHLDIRTCHQVNRHLALVAETTEIFSLPTRKDVWADMPAFSLDPASLNTRTGRALGRLGPRAHFTDEDTEITEEKVAYPSPPTEMGAEPGTRSRSDSWPRATDTLKPESHMGATVQANTQEKAEWRRAPGTGRAGEGQGCGRKGKLLLALRMQWETELPVELGGDDAGGTGVLPEDKTARRAVLS